MRGQFSMAAANQEAPAWSNGQTISRSQYGAADGGFVM
jgi:hypothetical protein